jgi:hypothetical protein
MMPLDEMTMEYLGVEVNQQKRAALYRTNLLILGTGRLNVSGEEESVPRYLTLVPLEGQ